MTKRLTQPTLSNQLRVQGNNAYVGRPSMSTMTKEFQISAAQDFCQYSVPCYLRLIMQKCIICPVVTIIKQKTHAIRRMLPCYSDIYLRNVKTDLQMYFTCTNREIQTHVSSCFLGDTMDFTEGYSFTRAHSVQQVNCSTFSQNAV